MPCHPGRRLLAVFVSIAALTSVVAAISIIGGTIPGPLPIFPSDNWWNVDITNAPVDSASASYITFIGPTKGMRPDFGGDVSPGSVQVYGFPYAVVDGTAALRTVQFQYADESDGVNHTTNQSFPFYPIPDEAIAQAHWVEGGEPGNLDLRSSSDRHLIMVDRDRRYLYELYNVFYDGSQWHAGSGAFFDLKTNGRRPDGWTSADAAGLPIFPGLARYDEVAAGRIAHALRFTCPVTRRAYVPPARHFASTQTDSFLPPMGMRVRLKAGVDISGFPADVQVLLTALKTYGMMVADNGGAFFVTGAPDPRWNDADIDTMKRLHAGDFEVVKMSGLVIP